MTKTGPDRPDLDRFRLRNFVSELVELGEVDEHAEPAALGQVSAILEATSKAVLFRHVAPEGLELVGNVMGLRRRLAAMMGVAENEAVETFLQRRKAPIAPIEIVSGEAPVQHVVLQGDDIDLSRLPFHLQHEFDGGPYISSAIDFTIDPESGRTNVGARRLSLRNRTECGTNLTGASDVKRMYLAAAARGERLPIAFAIGCHPTISMGAEESGADEIGIIGGLRREALPIVKCLTSDIRVPADAEMILEGYLDERGYREPDGPYGEYLGYYGEMHMDPVFHCTTITMRPDPLHQTVLHGSTAALDHTDTSHTNALQTEAMILDLLRTHAIAEPVAVRAIMGSGVSQHVRVAIRQRRPGDARAVIMAVLGALWRVKHIWVYDEDVDPHNETLCEWALATRFQGDRDLVRVDNAWGYPIDPSLSGRRLGTKLGFDCTRPLGRQLKVTDLAPSAPIIRAATEPAASLREALASGPKHFAELMRLLGRTDGRDLVLELDALRQAGMLGRNQDGQYLLHPSHKGATFVLP